MSADMIALAAVALMAAITFATRAGGYLMLRAARPGARLERFLEAAPKTLFVALITPALAAGGIDHWAGAAATVALMAATGSVPAAIAGGTALVALIRAAT